LQSTQETEFSEIDIAVLRTMADQVALAIDNAHLFRQTQTVLEEVQALQRRYMTHAWKGFLTAQPMIQIDYAQPGTESGAVVGARAGTLLRRVRREVTAQGQTVVTTPQQVEDLGTTMVVPLKLREQVIGTITLHEMDQQRQWTDEDVALAETVAEQVALTIENLRLMDETQRRAARERLVNELSEQMQRAPDMETLMRITAEGLNKTLGGSRAFVRMGTAAELAGGEGSGHTSEEERQREI
jgi:GAF domain-containing protein